MLLWLWGHLYVSMFVSIYILNQNFWYTDLIFTVTLLGTNLSVKINLPFNKETAIIWQWLYAVTEGKFFLVHWLDCLCHPPTITITQCVGNAKPRLEMAQHGSNILTFLPNNITRGLISNCVNLSAKPNCNHNNHTLSSGQWLVSIAWDLI